MTKGRWGRWMGMLCGIALAGCGSSSSGGPASPQTFCNELATIEEQLYDRCTNGSGLPNDVLTIDMDCLGFAEAEAAGRMTYHSSQAQVCLGWLEGLSCAQLNAYLSSQPYLEWASLPASCQEAVVGTVAEGGACDSILGYECVAGDYCAITNSEVCVLGGATCQAFAAAGGDCTSTQCAPGYSCQNDLCVAQAFTILGVGGDCSASETVCDTGLYCNGGTCAARGAAGTSCTSADQCLEGQRCPPSSGVCAAPLEVGQTCKGGDCDVGLYCDDSGSCAAMPTLGATCATPASGDAVYCVGSYCDDTAATPICTAYLAPGQVCLLNDEETRFLTMCGPGYACDPIGITGSTNQWGVCGRIHCVTDF